MIFHNTNCDTQLVSSVEQRLEDVEHKISALQGYAEYLQQMLNEQRELIREYITGQMASSNNLDNENVRPEDAIFTFVCRQQFAELEKEIKKIKKSVDSVTNAQ